MRYFIAFAYRGTAYHGWQRQPNAVSVQQVLEEALSTLLREPVTVVGAGRTDAGVHAREMYAHMDLGNPLQCEDLVYRLNALLPSDIAVRSMFPVPETAHARFDATARTYEYHIHFNKNPFLQEFSHYVKSALDISAMKEASKYLLGKQDFKCFSRSHTDVKTFICDLHRAEWELREDRLVFTISADRFLRNMVRAVVGTLLEVGKGKLQPGDVKGIIKSRDRQQAGASVPAKGLYLTRVNYPEELLAKEPKNEPYGERNR